MITLEIKDDQVTAALQRLARHMSDMSQVMNAIGEALEYQTEQRFDQGVSPDGVPWAPKSQTTIEAYTRRGYAVDFRPLFGPNLDGTPLRTSFFRQYGPDFVEVGTNKIQAAVMQFGAAQGAFGTSRKGGPIPWGNIPARPFLGLSDIDRENITAEVEEWLEEVVDTDH
jgi:phage virion morphogenesis protein